MSSHRPASEQEKETTIYDRIRKWFLTSIPGMIIIGVVSAGVYEYLRDTVDPTAPISVSEGTPIQPKDQPTTVGLITPTTPQRVIAKRKPTSQPPTPDPNRALLQITGADDYPTVKPAVEGAIATAFRKCGIAVSSIADEHAGSLKQIALNSGRSKIVTVNVTLSSLPSEMLGQEEVHYQRAAVTISVTDALRGDVLAGDNGKALFGSHDSAETAASTAAVRAAEDVLPKILTMLGS